MNISFWSHQARCLLEEQNQQSVFEDDKWEFFETSQVCTFFSESNHLLSFGYYFYFFLTNKERPKVCRIDVFTRFVMILSNHSLSEFVNITILTSNSSFWLHCWCIQSKEIMTLFPKGHPALDIVPYLISSKWQSLSQDMTAMHYWGKCHGTPFTSHRKFKLQ